MNVYTAFARMSDRSAHATTTPQRVQRLLLYPGELYGVPAAFGGMRVVSGKAYLTQSGQDRIVGVGEAIVLNPHDDLVLVSALNGMSLVIELFTHTPV
jgi:hypothetical protein